MSVEAGTWERSHFGVEVDVTVRYCPVVGEMRGKENMKHMGLSDHIMILHLLNFIMEHPSCVLPTSVITTPETPFPCMHLLMVFRYLFAGFISEGVIKHS